MSRDEKIESIKNSKIFTGLPDELIIRIVESSQPLTISEKKEVIEQGKPSKNLYIICEGVVRVYKLTEEGVEVHLGVRGKGELVGLQSLFTDETHDSTAYAMQDVTALVLGKSEVEKLMIEYPALSLRLFSYLSRLVRKQNRRLEESRYGSIEDRIVKTLTILSKKFDTQVLSLTHDEMSMIVGATRPRVSEVLEKLEKSGKLKLGQKSITLLP